MTFRLRPGQPGDAPAVAAVHEAAARVAYAHIFPPDAPFPTAATRRRWETFKGKLVVATEATVTAGAGDHAGADGGRIFGFVATVGGELDALYVLPDYWGRGLGRRLLAAAGPVRRLWVLRDNLRARRFYERNGWRADGMERAPDGAPELRYRLRYRPPTAPSP